MIVTVNKYLLQYYYGCHYNFRSFQMNIAKILLLALGIMTVVYMVYLVRDVATHKEEHLPMKTVPVLLIGLLANFFDIFS